MTAARKLSPIPAWHQEVSEETNSPVDSSCIGLAGNIEPEVAIQLATEFGYRHLCQREGHEFDKEMRAAQALINNEDKFLTYPISSILSPDETTEASEARLTSLSMKFNCSSQKRKVLDGLIKTSQGQSFSQTITDDIVAVADEMFTNAIYNAPFVDINTQKNPGVSRLEPNVKLPPGKFASIFLAHDQSRIVIGCMDPFGSLDLKRYLNKINATYSRGPAAAINFGPGGAGIGSYIIFNAGSSLYFGVWPGAATIITCVIPLGLSNRKRIQLPKHLHWIQR